METHIKLGSDIEVTWDCDENDVYVSIEGDCYRFNWLVTDLEKRSTERHLKNGWLWFGTRSN